MAKKHRFPSWEEVKQDLVSLLSKIKAQIQKKRTLWLSSVLIFCLLAFAFLFGMHFFFHHDYVNDTSVVLQVLLTVCGGILVIQELISNRAVDEGEFLANLNTMFVTNPDYKRCYTLLQQYVDAEKEGDDTKIEEAMKALENLAKADISNYLTFFEVFQLLIDRNTLSIDMFDDLFAHRFFMAVHNPYFQKEKLIGVPENFRNIYRLEHDWIEYRQKHKRKIYGMNHSLRSQYLLTNTEKGYEKLIRK